MPKLSEGALEKGYWEPAKEKAQSPVVQAKSWIVEFLRPEILNKPCSQERNKPIRRTAWLDGLRGFAAFLVYIGHHELWAHDIVAGGAILENGFGYNGNYYFATMPGIRTFFCGGHFSVTIFFVISGYVLSAKPLSLIQSGDYARLVDNVSSALFRRWLRLYLPLAAVTFLYMNIARLVITPASIELKGTYREELWNWWNEFLDFSFIFRMESKPWFAYHFHAWSIPVEFRGSVVVYTTLIAFAKIKRNVRLVMQLLLIVYYIWFVNGWFCALFTWGMFLCDLDLLNLDGNLPSILKRLEPYKLQIAYFFFAAALYLGGVPAHEWDMTAMIMTPGWGFLAKLKPYAAFDYKWFYLFFGAAFMVASIPRIYWLKAFFETRFCQYLGRISFSLYLVHGPVIWTIGERVYAAVGFSRPEPVAAAWANLLPITQAGPLGLEPAIILPQIVLLPITFWVAEIVTKVFDEPSLKFAHWLYRRVLAPPTIKL